MPKTGAEPGPSAPEGQAVPVRQRSRDGTKRLQLFVSEEAHRSLKALAAKRGEYLENMLLTALDQYLLEIDAGFTVTPSRPPKSG